MKYEFVMGIILSTIPMALLGIVVFNASTYEWQQEAIKHNAAHYDQKTGVWMWNEEVK